MKPSQAEKKLAFFLFSSSPDIFHFLNLVVVRCLHKQNIHTIVTDQVEFGRLSSCNHNTKSMSSFISISYFIIINNYVSPSNLFFCYNYKHKINIFLIIKDAYVFINYWNRCLSRKILFFLNIWCFFVITTVIPWKLMHAAEAEFSDFDAEPKSKRSTLIKKFRCWSSWNESKVSYKEFFFIFAPRLDFGYASKPENSACDAMH
jgi:hypothetical protein